MSVDGKAHIASVLRAARGPLSAEGMRQTPIAASSPSGMPQRGNLVVNVAVPTTVAEYNDPKKHPLQPHDGKKIASEASVASEK